MKLLWILLTMQTFWLTSAQYHEISMKEFLPPPDETPPLPSEAVFGYSFAYQSGTRSLIISAPRADYIGKIYSCDIDFKSNCRPIKYNITRASPNYTHDYWLGATVKASSEEFFTCAPRYIELGAGYGIYGEFGHCYKSKKGGQLLPLSQIRVSDRQNSTKLFQETMDSFGWSMDVVEGPSSAQKSILIGGPAMFTGRVMKIHNSIVSSTHGYQHNVNVSFNLGYSVTGGTFFNKLNIFYAFGSPYGEDGYGKVVFFAQDLRALLVSLKPESVGTLFGAVLATAHISGGMSGVTDLLVGAPAYEEQHKHDVGAVYYYETAGKIRQLSIKPSKVIIGQKAGSYFGGAIASVGDLNGDGRDEIAIAAPYEDDGRGAVYLYCGSHFLQETTTTTWLQRIQPENYRSFGLSISALKDYDENGCNELAIGAPENNTVTLYRCMASVVVEVFAKFPNLQDRRNEKSPYPDRNETYFIFKSCMNVSYPEKLKEVIAKIEVNVQILHSHATLAMPHKDGNYSVSLHERKQQYCEDIGVNVPQHGNYNMKIFYKIDARLLESPVNDSKFDARRVILSDLSKLSDANYVSAAECKDQKACTVKLNLTIDCSHKTYVIGSNESITVKLNIKNEGEIAYDSCVKVRIEGVPLMKTPSTSCTYTSNNNELTCAPITALQTNANWATEEIILDIEKLTNKNKGIAITAHLYDHCMNSTGFKKYNETIKLKATSGGITIKGQTNIGEVVNMTTLEVSTTGKQFQHIYSITNKGLPNWVEVACELELPKLPYIKFNENSVVVVADSSLSMCTITESEDTDKIKANCILNSINEKSTTYIHVVIVVTPNTLDDILYNQNVTITTKLKVFFDDDIKTQRVNTVVVLRDIDTPWWIILIAAIIGLLILIIIILILRQFGFLQRKQKKNLKALRSSVRRQTIRRSMMQQHSEDRRRLTEVPLEAEVTPPCSQGEDNRIHVD